MHSVPPPPTLLSLPCTGRQHTTAFGQNHSGAPLPRSSGSLYFPPAKGSLGHWRGPGRFLLRPAPPSRNWPRSPPALHPFPAGGSSPTFAGRGWPPSCRQRWARCCGTRSSAWRSSLTARVGAPLRLPPCLPLLLCARLAGWLPRCASMDARRPGLRLQRGASQQLPLVPKVLTPPASASHHFLRHGAHPGLRPHPPRRGGGVHWGAHAAGAALLGQAAAAPCCRRGNASGSGRGGAGRRCTAAAAAGAGAAAPAADLG